MTELVAENIEALLDVDYDQDSRDYLMALLNIYAYLGWTAKEVAEEIMQYFAILDLDDIKKELMYYIS